MAISKPNSTVISKLDSIVEKGTDTIKKTLKRSLGLAGVVIISLSAMLPGIFVTPTFAADIMGPGIWLAFIVAAAVVLPAAISKAELSSGMPSSGGSYVYLERTYGPMIGTISGLGLWASFLLKSGFALIGFSAYFIAVTTYFDIQMRMMVLSMSALVLITIVNILGVKKVKAIQTPVLFVTLAMLTITCVAAFFVDGFDGGRPFRAAFDTDLWTLAETSAFVFVAYAGVTKVAAIGGEVKDPEKNLPAGMLLSLLIATILYSAIAYLMMAAIPGEWWKVDGKVVEDPIYVFAKEVVGTEFGIVAAIISVLAMISMALAGILASSRFLYAMGQDKLLPPALERVHEKYETPHWPIIVTGVAMGLAIFFVPLKDVVKLASGFKIMIFIMINTCVIILRQTSDRHGWDPSYKGIFYPFMQIWGIVAGLFLIYFIGDKAFIGASAAIAAGLVTYFLYGKRHAQISKTPFQSFRESMTGRNK
ncbi:MAG TPA: amino acid permease [Candidatus Poseidoniales archaeon]|nr:MAG TPA: amino acid permease [Candidatus Poseidoniales archaeon]HII24944.1 amino acid permease [Candidatus Poseidoniaceae archaeon]